MYRTGYHDFVDLVRNPEVLLDIYAKGLFPMSNYERGGYLVDPDIRGVIEVDEFHVAHSLRKFMKDMPFTLTIDQDFAGVIDHCAELTSKREETWINRDIRAMFTGLHALGHAHSVECWNGEKLVGGLYVLSMNGLVCGESMFSRETNASKVALVHLVDHMKACGQTLLDTQFTTPHLKTFGAKDVPRETYHIMMRAALNQDVQWARPQSHNPGNPFAEPPHLT